MDDLLDFTGSIDTLGKPVTADLNLGPIKFIFFSFLIIGIATAPVLFALEQFPELVTLIKRKFQEPGDIERAIELVKKNNSLARTHELATKYSSKAIDTIHNLSPSKPKDGLEYLANLVITRKS